jgi:5'-nucleotidase
MTRRVLVAVLLLTCARPASAFNIVLSNDDGLTSNVVALYTALKAEGHDVIVSVPCTGQSGRGAAIVMYSTTVIVPDNDKTQIEAEGSCHNGAAPTGAPAVGPFVRAEFANGDFYYVHGTPVMATMYGLDVVAKARWGKAPDLVLSGPNEGQNVGLIVNSSGTVGNVQFAAGRGL